MRRLLQNFIAFVFIVMLSATALMACEPLKTGSAVSLDGSKIKYTYYHKLGGSTPDNVTLVLVHGWACDQSYWDSQLLFFHPRYNLVTLDLAGHGGSDETRSVYTVEAFSQDVKAVVEELELETVVLVGHSLGASVVLEAAKLLPDTVIGVVGVESYHHIGQEIPAPENMEPLYQAFALDYEASARAFLEQTFVEATPEEVMEKVINDAIAAPPSVETAISSMRELYVYNYNLGQKTAFESLSIPIRAINSDAYPYDIEAGKACTDSFEMYHMSNVGHYLMLEDPDTFNFLLEDVVDDIRGME